MGYGLSESRGTDRVAAARTTGCYRKSVPGTTKHTGCSRTHTHEHRCLWREAALLDSQLGTVLGKKAEPVGGCNGGGGIARRRPCGACYYRA
jgi:hypothetical protein